MFAALLKKIKLKIAIKHCVGLLLCSMPMLSNAGTYNEKVLQPAGRF